MSFNIGTHAPVQKLTIYHYGRYRSDAVSFGLVHPLAPGSGYKWSSQSGQADAFTRSFCTRYPVAVLKRRARKQG